MKIKIYRTNRKVPTSDWLAGDLNVRGYLYIPPNFSTPPLVRDITPVPKLKLDRDYTFAPKSVIDVLNSIGLDTPGYKPKPTFIERFNKKLRRK